MDSDLSSCDISVLVRALLSRPRDAFDEIVRRHLPKMRRIARRELRRRSIPEAVYDEDDLLSSSNRMFFSLILAGKVHSIQGLDELWVVYRRIVADKVTSARNRTRARKRGAVGRWNGRKRCFGPADADATQDDAQNRDDLNLFESGLPRPEVSAIADETLRLLLDLLNDEQRMIANLRLDNLSISEIAKRLRRSERTINRKLEEIREIWRSTGQIDGV